jgi:hypothetical protein
VTPGVALAEGEPTGVDVSEAFACVVVGVVVVDELPPHAASKTEMAIPASRSLID